MSHKLTWTDSTGEQWSCAIRLSDAKRLRDTGIDLFDPEKLQTLFADTLGTIELVGELLRPQWEERGIAYVDFADRVIDGHGVFAAATATLQAAIADFFQRIDRPALAMVIERTANAARTLETQALTNAAGEQVGTLLAAMQAKSQSVFDAEIARALASIERPEPLANKPAQVGG
jgi:hypothetical protein